MRIEGQAFHFVGIGGCGMSGLAIVIHELGGVVSGSDEKEGIFVSSLRQRGIDVSMGHEAKQVPGGAVVVYSSAIRVDNVERRQAQMLSLVELHRSDLIAVLTRRYRTLAVCGAHGKTTTSTILAHVLTACGLDPTYIVGGLPRAPMPHAKAGRSDLLVIEADESDRSLEKYDAETLLVTNIDLDHVRDGGYKTIDDVAQVIGTLVKRATRAVMPKAASKFYSTGNVQVSQPQPSGREREFRLSGQFFTAPLPGFHQMENAALVVEAALSYGCEPRHIEAALCSFPGIARRLEAVGRTEQGVEILDDYAHHPTELEAVLNSSLSVTRGRVFVVFQPHLFSRTQAFYREFGQALSVAHKSFIVPIYPSRERQADWPNVSSSLIVDAATEAGHRNVFEADSLDWLKFKLKQETLPGDLVVVAGAGDISKFAHQLAQT